jgi:gliding motility-associated-like protein
MVLGCTAAQAQVVINEVNVSNMNGLSVTDPFNGGSDNEDWIELYNTGAAAVDLSGWHLSDDSGNPTVWTFPAGASIAANGRLVVLASGWNGLYGGYYCTNFKLNQTAQDHVVLAQPGGTIVDDKVLDKPTMVDQTRGRTPDGSNTWSLILTPTPGAANGPASPEYVAKPTISPDAGYFTGSVQVTITGPAGASIRYTTNGDVPTTTSTLYAGPFNVSATTVVRAACFSSTPGVPSSFIETNTYFINVTHGVAVLSVAGDQLDDLLNGNGSIQPLGSFEYFGPDGVLRDEAVGSFNEHGQDSWAYNQRGFDYVTRDQTGYNDAIHYPVFRGSSRQKYQRLIIKALAGDNCPFGPGQPAHIRDPYVQSLAQIGGLRLDERSYEPAVLYLNGQYWGVYDMREKVDDADFFQKYYDQDENNVYCIKTWGGTWNEFGGGAASADWNALLNYINSNNMGDATAFDYVDQRYNWKSLIDYFCLNSYCVCADWLNWNTIWWKGLNPSGEHKKWGYALWDEDATFGHYGNFTGIPDQSANADPCTVEDLGDPGGQGHTVILRKLIDENPMVYDYYVNRYIDLGNTLFSCEFMNHHLDSLLAMVTPEMPAQCSRWGTTMANWQAGVQALRDFIDARCITTQQGLVDCYDLDGPYPVMFKVEPPGMGQISINSITPPAYPFTGVYYGGINTSLVAEGLNGYTFDHWETLHHALLPSMTDSAASLLFTTSDTIIAYFSPPTQYEIVLLTDPIDKAMITFNGQNYSSFPASAFVGEDVPIAVNVEPAMFYDFKYWEIKHNIPNTNDSTRRDFRIRFFGPDTIIAHLAPQEYGYWSPNAFTPNGDGYNDVWQPWGNVIDPESFELEIYDRWGRVMFATNDPYEGWDGTFSGTPAPLGVYAFKTHIIEGITRDKHDLLGHVTLIR